MTTLIDVPNFINLCVLIIVVLNTVNFTIYRSPEMVKKYGHFQQTRPSAADDDNGSGNNVIIRCKKSRISEELQIFSLQQKLYVAVIEYVNRHVVCSWLLVSWKMHIILIAT